MKWFLYTWLFLFSILTQSACQTAEDQATIQPTPQIEATEIVQITSPTPVSSVEEPGSHLTICLSAEPQSLYWHSEHSPAEKSVLHSIFENDLTTLSYKYQARGLERVPSFQNGDASIRVVPVDEDDRVVDAGGQVIRLQSGSVVIDSEGNLREYDGSTLLLNQLVVDYRMKQRNWSDGQPVTAADSVYSFQLLANADSPGDKFLAERTANYQSTGNLQIRWTGLPGFETNSFHANFHHPLPRHTWLNLEIAELESAEPSSILLVGDGPFQIMQWLPGESIHLEPNPFYYRSGQMLPRLNSVTYRFISDMNQRVSQLLAGECHVLTHDGISPDLIPFFLEAQEEGLLQTSINPDKQYWELIFGINSWNDYGDGSGRPDWFEDVRARQAAAMCIDRQDIIDNLYLGQSTIADNYIPSIHPLFANDISQWPYNPNAANSLLDELNFLDSNLDGIREDPQTANDFRISLLVGIESDEYLIAKIIEEDLKACGIEVFIERQSPEDQASNLLENKVNGRRFDLAITVSEASHVPQCMRFLSSQISGPDDQINPITEESFKGWNSKNHSGWTNPTFDAICTSALNAQSGTAEELLNHQQAQRIFAEQLPVLPLAYIPKITIMHPHVQNLSNDPSQESELWNLFEITLDNG